MKQRSNYMLKRTIVHSGIESQYQIPISGATITPFNRKISNWTFNSTYMNLFNLTLNIQPLPSRCDVLNFERDAIAKYGLFTQCFLNLRVLTFFREWRDTRIKEIMQVLLNCSRTVFLKVCSAEPWGSMKTRQVFRKKMWKSIDPISWTEKRRWEFLFFFWAQFEFIRTIDWQREALVAY